MSRSLRRRGYRLTHFQFLAPGIDENRRKLEGHQNSGALPGFNQNVAGALLGPFEREPQRFRTFLGGHVDFNDGLSEDLAVFPGYHLDDKLARRVDAGRLFGGRRSSVIGSFDSIYVVTCEKGHWGVKARSSFAP